MEKKEQQPVESRLSFFNKNGFCLFLTRAESLYYMDDEMVTDDGFFNSTLGVY